MVVLRGTVLLIGGALAGLGVGLAFSIPAPGLLAGVGAGLLLAGVKQADASPRL